MLNRWCDIHCPHAAEHGPLLARYDHQYVPGQPKAWRCYAQATLDETRQRYTNGKLYCTRAHHLEVELEACVAHRAGQSTRATVSAVGATQHARPQSPQRRADGSDMSPLRIGIVVIRCNEMLPWLRDVQRGLRIGAARRPVSLELHVYEACGSRDEDAWHRLSWNRERRTHLSGTRVQSSYCIAFLHYLRDLYAALPEAVLFFRGDGARGSFDFYRQSQIFAERLVHNRGAVGIFGSIAEQSYVSMAASMSDCNELRLVHCTGAAMEFSCLQRLSRRHNLIAAEAPRAFANYAGGQFGVTRDRILGRPLTFYTELLEDLESADKDACLSNSPASSRDWPPSPVGGCVLLEHMWPMIMGEDHVLDPRKTLTGESAIPSFSRSPLR